MTVVSNRDAVSVVLELCALQRRLVERFLEDLRPNDLERFSDVARTGTLNVGTQSWSYTRHGAGVLFKTPGATVDAHVGPAAFPDATDGWRLLQYLESIGVATLTFEGELTVIDDEKDADRILDRMALAGILETVRLRPPTRIFRPSPRRVAPS